jgi:hypothetical protein
MPAILNNLTALTPEVWSSMIQKNNDPKFVGTKIASMDLRSELNYGDRIHKPYVEDLTTIDYVRGTNIVTPAVTPTDDFIDVLESRVVPFYVDTMDKIQNKYEAAMIYSERAAESLRKDIDTKILAETLNASVSLEGPDINEAAGPITLTTANVYTTLTTAMGKLGTVNVMPEDDFAWVISPMQAMVLQEKFFTSGFTFADAALRNGLAGKIAGVEIYVSNQLDVTGGHTNSYFGRKGGIEAVMQAQPTVVEKDPEGKLGKLYYAYYLAGFGVLTRKADTFLNVHLA